jgi:hypothetical protein
MNKQNVLIEKFSGDLAPVSPRLQRAANSTTLWFLLIMIFIRMPVTFLIWHSYFVVKLTLIGEAISATRNLLENKTERHR